MALSLTGPWFCDDQGSSYGCFDLGSRKSPIDRQLQVFRGLQRIAPAPVHPLGKLVNHSLNGGSSPCLDPGA